MDSPTTESTSEIYSNACAEIAANFADRGYRFAKSGPHASRSSDSYKFEIGFHSSFRNSAGAFVALIVSCGVYSKRLEEWRGSQELIVTSDCVASGQIGNLTDDVTSSEWNLADTESRVETISNIVSTIESVALPYFSQFDDTDTLITTLLNRDVPSMTIDKVIEFLMCFTDQGTARQSAINFLRRRRNLLRSYTRDYQRYGERGLASSHPSGFAKQVAFASHLFGFGDLTEAAGG